MAETEAEWLEPREGSRWHRDHVMSVDPAGLLDGNTDVRAAAIREAIDAVRQEIATSRSFGPARLDRIEAKLLAAPAPSEPAHPREQPTDSSPQTTADELRTLVLF